jgi:hypothetical protein
MGIALPIADALSALIFGHTISLPSISATHYMNSYLLFEGLVFATGLFLVTYRGYDILDHILSIIAGCGAVLLTLMPCTYGGSPYVDDHNWLMLPQSITNVFHLVGAGIFFGCLFIIIEFQFPKTVGTVVSGSEKAKRNLLYRICGGVMLGGLLLGFLPFINFTIGPFDNCYIGEAIALWSFGIAWLVKGEVFMRDKSKETNNESLAN